MMPKMDRRIIAITEEIALLSMMAGPEDKESLSQAYDLLKELQGCLPSDLIPSVMPLINTILQLITEIDGKKARPAEPDYRRLVEEVSNLQLAIEKEFAIPALAKSESQKQTAGSPRSHRENEQAEHTADGKNEAEPNSQVDGALNGKMDHSINEHIDKFETASINQSFVSEIVDQSLFQEFIANKKIELEDLEGLILAIEQGDESAKRKLRRIVHTYKGEAGVLGLKDLELVCHAVEDYLEEETDINSITESLLIVYDWICEAFEAYKECKLPATPSQKIVDLLLKNIKMDDVDFSTVVDDSIAARIQDPESNQPPILNEQHKAENNQENKGASNKQWAEDELPIVIEFLQQSEEEISGVDQVLIHIEQTGLDVEKINQLFRVFHTIKGVAASIELKQISHLAHATETLLNSLRNEEIEVSPTILDVVFDATSMMQRLLNEVRQAIQSARAVEWCSEVEPVIERLVVVSKNGQPKEKEINHEQHSQRQSQVKNDGTKTNERTSKLARGIIKETVKIDLERVDSLVEMIGELVIVESMVTSSNEINNITAPGVRNSLSHLAKITRDLQTIGMRMRMVPLRGVFQKMSRIVRDLARKSHKDILLEISGEGVEMDRSLVEQINDPLVHLIRNSVDHGIEPEEERHRNGKPKQAKIYLSAFHEGGNIVIEIRDDGRGLNREAILQKAQKQNLLGERADLTDSEIFNLIFLPGFSTAKKITEISGRGVGMDVVKRNVEAMRGRILIESTPNKGTIFKLILPLTLAIIDGMLVGCGEEQYIIPTLSIVESIQPKGDMLSTVAGRGEVINVRGEILPLVRLDRLFRIQGAKQDFNTALVVIVETIGKKIGLLVDKVITQQQVVIKSLGESLKKVKYVSGATILSDGRVGLILNIDELRDLLTVNNEENIGRNAALSTWGREVEMTV